MENKLTCYKDEQGNYWIRKYIGNGTCQDEMIYENKDFTFEKYFNTKEDKKRMTKEIKEVYVMDLYYSETGDYNTFNSVYDAANYLNISAKELTKAIKDRKVFTAGSFNHRYFATYEESDMWIIDNFIF